MVTNGKIDTVTSAGSVLVGAPLVRSMEEKIAEPVGFAVSATVHGFLVALAVFGGPLFQSRDAQSLSVAEVTLISVSEFGALLSENPDVDISAVAAVSSQAGEAAPPVVDTPSVRQLEEAPAATVRTVGWSEPVTRTPEQQPDVAAMASGDTAPLAPEKPRDLETPDPLASATPSTPDSINAPSPPEPVTVLAQEPNLERPVNTGSKFVSSEPLAPELRRPDLPSGSEPVEIVVHRTSLAMPRAPETTPSGAVVDVASPTPQFSEIVRAETERAQAFLRTTAPESPRNAVPPEPVEVVAEAPTQSPELNNRNEAAPTEADTPTLVRLALRLFSSPSESVATPVRTEPADSSANPPALTADPSAASPAPEIAARSAPEMPQTNADAHTAVPESPLDAAPPEPVAVVAKAPALSPELNNRTEPTPTEAEPRTLVRLALRLFSSPPESVTTPVRPEPADDSATLPETPAASPASEITAQSAPEMPQTNADAHAAVPESPPDAAPPEPVEVVAEAPALSPELNNRTEPTPTEAEPSTLARLALRLFSSPPESVTTPVRPEPADDSATLPETPAASPASEITARSAPEMPQTNADVHAAVPESPPDAAPPEPVEVVAEVPAQAPDLNNRTEPTPTEAEPPTLARLALRLFSSPPEAETTPVRREPADDSATLPETPAASPAPEITARSAPEMPQTNADAHAAVPESPPDAAPPEPVEVVAEAPALSPELNNRTEPTPTEAEPSTLARLALRLFSSPPEAETTPVRREPADDSATLPETPAASPASEITARSAPEMPQTNADARAAVPESPPDAAPPEPVEVVAEVPAQAPDLNNRTEPTPTEAEPPTLARLALRLFSSPPEAETTPVRREPADDSATLPETPAASPASEFTARSAPEMPQTNADERAAVPESPPDAAPPEPVEIVAEVPAQAPDLNNRTEPTPTEAEPPTLARLALRLFSSPPEAETTPVRREPADDSATLPETPAASPASEFTARSAPEMPQTNADAHAAVPESPPDAAPPEPVEVVAEVPAQAPDLNNRTEPTPTEVEPPTLVRLALRLFSSPAESVTTPVRREPAHDSATLPETPAASPAPEITARSAPEMPRANAVASAVVPESSHDPSPPEPVAVMAEVPGRSSLAKDQTQSAPSESKTPALIRLALRLFSSPPESVRRPVPGKLAGNSETAPEQSPDTSEASPAPEVAANKVPEPEQSVSTAQISAPESPENPVPPAPVASVSNELSPRPASRPQAAVTQVSAAIQWPSAADPDEKSFVTPIDRSASSVPRPVQRTNPPGSIARTRIQAALSLQAAVSGEVLRLRAPEVSADSDQAPVSPKTPGERTLASLEAALAGIETNSASVQRAFSAAGKRLSASEYEYLRRRISSCWNVINLQGVSSAPDLRVTILVALKKDGYVEGEPQLVRPARLTTRAYRVAFVTAGRAVKKCEPYDRLPAEKYARWRRLEITFDPEGMVMR